MGILFAGEIRPDPKAPFAPLVTVRDGRANHHQIRQAWKDIFVKHHPEEVPVLASHLKKQVGWFPLVITRFFPFAGLVIPLPGMDRPFVLLKPGIYFKLAMVHEGVHILQKRMKSIFMPENREGKVILLSLRGFLTYNRLMDHCYESIQKEYYVFDKVSWQWLRKTPMPDLKVLKATVAEAYLPVAKKQLRQFLAPAFYKPAPEVMVQAFRTFLMAEREAHGLVGQYRDQLGLNAEDLKEAENSLIFYRIFSQLTRQALREVIGEGQTG